MTGILKPNFLSYDNLINILMITSVYVIIALGEGAILITKGTDLSAGRVVGLTACVAASMLQRTDYASRIFPDIPAMPLIVPILIAVVVGLFVGLINGGIVAWLKVPPFIATLGTMTIAYGAVSLYVDRPPHGACPIGGLRNDFTDVANGAIPIAGNVRLPYIIIIAAVVLLVMWVIFNRTRLGKNIYAIGANPDAAVVSGVNVNRTLIVVYVIAGALYGLAGSLQAARQGSATNNLGYGWELDAISACVIGGVSTTGGIGTVGGILTGVLMLTFMNNALVFLNVSPVLAERRQGHHHRLRRRGGHQEVPQEEVASPPRTDRAVLRDGLFFRACRQDGPLRLCFATGMEHYDAIIVGSGPAGLGAAFELLGRRPGQRLLLIDRNQYSSGGLRNDCKMNFSWPIGFPEHCWDEATAGAYLRRVEARLEPVIMEKHDLERYTRRADKLGVRLLEVRQAHLGTDGGLELIKKLTAELSRQGACLSLGETALELRPGDKVLVTDRRELGWDDLIVAPGRSGFAFLQAVMTRAGVPFTDNVVDIGIRVETREEHYPIVRDYYDPKFLFPKRTRTFCTNSRAAHVVQEKYEGPGGQPWYSVNGHAWSASRPANGLVNFAMLKTVTLTEPLASGQAYAAMLGAQAALLGGGAPIMQRVGDFRLGKRSTRAAFSEDLYDFEPTLPSATPGDIGLVAPAKILRAIWDSMKLLDTVIPGLLHPGTIMYYPEIKLYANRPVFRDGNFQALPHLYLVGDGAGTSRGITAAWASGLRAADGILGA